MLLPSAGVLLAGLAAITAGATTANSTEFDWSVIEPTADLRYRTRTIAIAIATLPASVPFDHSNYGGTIILNPGGPGDLGVNLVRFSGRHLQKVIDNNKKYDYMGFDPRAIGNTAPQLDCFGGDTLTRNAYQQVLRGLGTVGSSEDALQRFLVFSNGLGTLCENTLGKSSILEHVTTAAVCRDMVEMVDRVDELRKKEVISIKRRRGMHD